MKCFIASKEGVNGGFSLACDPGEVTLRALYEPYTRGIYLNRNAMTAAVVI
jgi:hypothetical protein